MHQSSLYHLIHIVFFVTNLCDLPQKKEEGNISLLLPKINSQPITY